ncbi:hypothetical protein [Halorarius halobius]|uniref:hypothetical protein n=1 Tax=Halorarius halobius TaxID=2962671 RepID=UPI0020CBAD7D|nr:hypothetical protein [Halorarius halobius]
MPMYERSASTEIEVIDRWDGGFGWLAHPEERATRASHAIRGEDGVWVFDPLDGPAVDDHLAELGEVAGVAVLSNFHGRDAAAFADRHGVSVHLASWMDRVAEQVDAPVERYDAPTGEWVPLADSGISVRTVDPTTGWREMVAYRAADGTLRVPDMVSSTSEMTVADERLGCYFAHRFAPPKDAFADVDPERVLLGHGRGISENAAEALDAALDDARRNLPRAVVSQAPTQIRGVVAAMLD